MIWFPALLLLWKGIITEGCGTVNPFLNEIIAPSVINFNNALEILACLAGNGNSEFYGNDNSESSENDNSESNGNDNSQSMGGPPVIQIGSTTYRKKTLCAGEARCARADAWPLQSTGADACAQEAAENGLNSFYIDDQGQCLSSNFPAVEGSESCSSITLEVYASDEVLSDYTFSPAVNNFVLRDFGGNLKTFGIDFEPACYGIYNYEFRHNGRLIAGTAFPKTRLALTTPLPACTEVSSAFWLRAYDDDSNYVGQPMYPAPVTTPGANC